MTGLGASLAAVPPPARLIAALACLTLIGAGTALFLLGPARGRAAALQARRVSLEREITQARAVAAALARDQREGADLQRRLEDIAQKLPVAREIPALYRRLHEAAVATGLGVALFQPREPRVQQHYTEIPIALAVEGTYHQLAAFLERVAALPRVVTVGGLRMTALDRPAASLRAEMTLATYTYRPVTAAPAGGPAGAQTQHGPGPGDARPEPAAGNRPAPPPPNPGTTSPSPAFTPPANIAHGPLDSSPPANIALGPLDFSRLAYAARGRRDPFSQASVPAGGSADRAQRPRPLITSAALTGIVRGPDGPLALVETPDGLGYILRAGDGIEEARVIRIDQQSVLFTLPPAAGRPGEEIVLVLRSRE
jgi:type IV pilus assembly protein PilO